MVRPAAAEFNARVRALSVRVLGGFAVDGVDQHAFGSRKARRLVELLAIGRGRMVPFDALQEELWGSQPPARPHDQLAVLASRMRALLGSGTLPRQDGGYRLRYDRLDVDDLEALTVDVERRHAAADPTGALVAARALLVLTAAGSPAPADSAWATAEIAAIERLLSRARHTVTETLLSQGRWAEAAEVAASEIARDPYDEVAVRAQMTALAMAGRIGSALSVFQSLRGLLADELGADPSRLTLDLHEAVLRGEIRAGTTESATVAGSIVGRDRELAVLAQRAAAADGTATQVVVVEGEAGIGKTSLLQEFAARRRGVGDLILTGTCNPLDRAVPLDAVMVAIAEHLRLIGDDAAQVLGAESATLAPLLGLVPARRDEPLLADGVPGPSVLYALLFVVLGRICSRHRVILLIDDAHLGGVALEEFVQYLSRRPIGLLLVAAVRPGEGESFAGFSRLELGPLDRSAATALVGADRVADLYRRSLGHPLLLLELAAAGDAGGLPAGLVDAVSARCETLGVGAATVRTAAVLGGGPIDPDLLSGVLSRPVMSVLDDLDRARVRRLVGEVDGRYTFRHDLIREAIAAGTSVERARVLHSQAARILAQRSGVDPIGVAEHAVAGGDRALAAQWLRAAAAKAGKRFDHQTAESLLTEAVSLHDEPVLRLDRARVRTLRGRYEEAIVDLDAFGDDSPQAWEVRAWTAYFARQFAAAQDCADAGLLAAQDPAMRARCLMVGGRTRHAAGDLDLAEAQLAEALRLAGGRDRLAAAAWLGIIRAHQSRSDEAIALMRLALRADVDVAHTAASLHALLFSGHAHAIAGRPAAALTCFGRYTVEVQRRQVPRFAGRGINFGGWVLRNVGDIGPGVDAHLEALEVADRHGTSEVRIAALLDLAENDLLHGDLDSALAGLEKAAEAFRGDLVFGWRLDFKLRLLRSRLALLSGQSAVALETSSALALSAERLGVPRYASIARLVGYRAGIDLGLPTDLAAVQAALDRADRSVAIEAWWWAGEFGSVLRNDHLIGRAEAGAARVLRETDSAAEVFQRYARGLIDRWRAR